MLWISFIRWALLIYWFYNTVSFKVVVCLHDWTLPYLMISSHRAVDACWNAFAEENQVRAVDSISTYHYVFLLIWLQSLTSIGHLCSWAFLGWKRIWRNHLALVMVWHNSWCLSAVWFKLWIFLIQFIILIHLQIPLWNLNTHWVEFNLLSWQIIIIDHNVLIQHLLDSQPLLLSHVIFTLGVYFCSFDLVDVTWMC